MKKLTVWILQTGEPLHIDDGNPRPMRAMNLANALIERGHNVTIWSAIFYHQEKKHRSQNYKNKISKERLKINLLSSPGYKKNISINRLIDHLYLAINLYMELKRTKEKPDVAFIGYPPIEVAFVLSEWLRRHNINYLLDVKDQWPQIFIDALPKYTKNLGRFFFLPYFIVGRRVMKNSTGITTMSEGFLDWAISFSGRNRNTNDRVFPLTRPKTNISQNEIVEAEIWWDGHGVKDDGTPRICFIGSHSPAFDIEPVFFAAKELEEKGIFFQFVFCGGGSEFENWKKVMTGLTNVCFVGWIDQPRIAVLSQRSIAALAPYKNVDNFILNLPNKIIDYLALGLPVLSPLRGEVMTLITQNEVGLMYNVEKNNTLFDCIYRLIMDDNLRKRLSQNAKVIYESKFSFTNIYGGLVNHLECLSYRSMD